MKKYIVIAVLAIGAGVLCSQPGWREQVGFTPDGSFLVSSGWKVKPAGKQIPLDTLPMATALSKDGKYLLVLNGGYKPPSILVLSVADMKEVSRIAVPDAWLGLAVAPDGKVYASGGSKATVYEYTLSPEGKIEAARQLVVVPEKERGRGKNQDGTAAVPHPVRAGRKIDFRLELDRRDGLPARRGERGTIGQDRPGSAHHRHGAEQSQEG